MLEPVLADWQHSTWLPGWAIASRLLTATLFGAAIGFEREWQSRPAGLRTHILVCLSAALAAILTIEITHMAAFEDDAMKADPIRLIEAVTAGVAFLAAGTIVFAKGEVHGLTTGAGMWAAGVVGLTAGLGYMVVATLATVLTVVILSLLRIAEKRYGNGDGGGLGNS
ncbi:MAG: MgtC/SapB family protein [Pseudomonadota bacterium]|nr:MgtC/SapB family protein [Pseudomonadota bacterium]